MHHRAKSSRFEAALALTVALATPVVYWLTAFPTISWWESSELTTAASVLGVVHPPGALIPTLIGWLALKLPVGESPAHLLNLLAGVVGGVVVLLTVLTARRLFTLTETATAANPATERAWVVALSALAALSFGFSQTLWANATLFTPYIFTALLTICIFLALLRWWDVADSPTAWHWTFVVLLLFGLDFSVHRTNMLLLPGAIVWALLRKPPVFTRLRHWIAGCAGLALGLGAQLLLLPIARGKPPLNSNDPSTLSRLWDYISLKQYGGGFLVDLFPRKGDFWSVQLADYLNGFRANFAALDGPLGLLGLLPLLLGLYGLIALWRYKARLAIGMLALFLLASLGAVFYFNLPTNYFRAMDRHYLPSFVLFAVLIVCGATSLMLLARQTLRGKLAIAVGLLLFLGALAQLTRNWPRLNNSGTFFAYDCGQNLLKSLPEQSILFVGSDIDTYPLWYMQTVERARPDVTVVNLSLVNTRWYLAQILASASNLGFTMTPDEIATHSWRPWRDTTITIPVDRRAYTDLPTATWGVPDTLYLPVPATVQGRYISGHDDFVLRLLKANQFRRPIFFTPFAAAPQVQWLMPYMRPEGLVNRLLPFKDPPADTAILIANLFSSYSYRGYADPAVTIEPPSRWLAASTYGAFVALAKAMTDTHRCQTLRNMMLTRIPLERFDAPEELVKALDSLCVSRPVYSALTRSGEQ